MRRIIVLLTAATVGFGLGGTSSLEATPGGLDKKGGHHCWTKCGTYGMYKGQYHCHKKPPCNKRVVRRHRLHGH